MENMIVIIFCFTILWILKPNADFSDFVPFIDFYLYSVKSQQKSFQRALYNQKKNLLDRWERSRWDSGKKKNRADPDFTCR